MTRFLLGWITGALSMLAGLVIVHWYNFWQSGQSGSGGALEEEGMFV